MSKEIANWIAKQGLVSWILNRLNDNDEYNWDTEYEKSYAEGYHDAMLYILDYLNVEHNKEYYQ